MFEPHTKTIDALDIPIYNSLMPKVSDTTFRLLFEMARLACESYGVRLDVVRGKMSSGIF